MAVPRVAPNGSLWGGGGGYQVGGVGTYVQSNRFIYIFQSACLDFNET